MVVYSRGASVQRSSTLSKEWPIFGANSMMVRWTESSEGVIGLGQEVDERRFLLGIGWLTYFGRRPASHVARFNLSRRDRRINSSGSPRHLRACSSSTFLVFFPNTRRRREISYRRHPHFRLGRLRLSGLHACNIRRFSAYVADHLGIFCGLSSSCLCFSLRCRFGQKLFEILQ